MDSSCPDTVDLTTPKLKPVLDINLINRSQMSRDLGIDVAHISRIISGKSQPSLALARRMADYLHVSIDDLCRAFPDSR